MYTVGRLARKYGLSRSTLLYYDSIGLLKPSQHSKGDYRQYSENDAERLQTICAYREAGVALKDIRAILDSQGDSELTQVLENRLKELREEADALQHQQKLVAGLLGKPDLLEKTARAQEIMDRRTWSSLLRSAGFSEPDMRRWHVDFERMSPEKHEQFLTFLRIPEEDRARIRSWAKSPQEALKLQQTSERFMGLFFKIFEGLERKGPGSGVDTTKAYSICKGLPPKPRILDIGCGSGVASVELAQFSGGHVTAADVHQPFLDEVDAKAKALNITEQISTVKADMAQLPFEPESFDLIWSEGAAYIMGFGTALENWKHFLKPGGCMVVSEAVMHKENSPREVTEFWAEGYPAVQDVQANLELIQKQGYEVLGHFPLPEQCWRLFYKDLEKHLEGMDKQLADTQDAMAILEEHRREIDLYRKHPGFFGYEFFILRK